MATQVINGQSYEQYTPEWYAAQRADVVNRAGVSGTAEGTGEANYLSKLSPTLAGLYSAIGGNGGGTSGASTPGTVSYGGSGGGTPGTVSYSAPSSTMGAPSVSSSGLTGPQTSTYNPTATIAPLNLAASDTASFANAKDQAGQTASASMLGLQQALAGRGMGGAGYEAGDIGRTLSTAANTIGAAGRAKAIEDANLTAQGNVANLNAGVAQRGQDIGAEEGAANRGLQGKEAAFSGDIAQRGQTLSEQEADANRQAEEAATAYSGGVTQRGQDIGAETAARNAEYSGSIAQRGQDIGAAESAADLAQRQAALKASQTLQILQSVLGGKSSSVQPGYVY